MNRTAGTSRGRHHPLFILGIGLLVFGCAASENGNSSLSDTTEPATGGAPSTGGAAQQGGSNPLGSGGATSRGGSVSAMGGTRATGVGGAGRTGGAAATGGAPTAAPSGTQLYNNYFATNCVSCHGAGQSPPYNSAASMCSTLKTFRYIGNGSASLQTLIRWFNQGGSMPPTGAAPANAVADITAWQNAGAVCP
jgi:hypothetical protein